MFKEISPYQYLRSYWHDSPNHLRTSYLQLYYSKILPIFETLRKTMLILFFRMVSENVKVSLSVQRLFAFLRTTRFGNTLSTGNSSIYVFPLEHFFSLLHPQQKVYDKSSVTGPNLYFQFHLPLPFSPLTFQLNVYNLCSQQKVWAGNSLSVHDSPLFRMSFSSHLRA